MRPVKSSWPDKPMPTQIRPAGLVTLNTVESHPPVVC
jgi:hypothetical protein